MSDIDENSLKDKRKANFAAAVESIAAAARTGEDLSPVLVERIQLVERIRVLEMLKGALDDIQRTGRRRARKKLTPQQAAKLAVATGAAVTLPDGIRVEPPGPPAPPNKPRTPWKKP